MPEVSAPDLAKQAALSPGAIQKWARAGLFPSAWQTPGGHWRIDPSDLEALKQRGRPAAKSTDVAAEDAA